MFDLGDEDDSNDYWELADCKVFMDDEGDSNDNCEPTDCKVFME
eukprot:gene26990-9006_t